MKIEGWAACGQHLRLVRVWIVRDPNDGAQPIELARLKSTGVRYAAPAPVLSKFLDCRPRGEERLRLVSHVDDREGDVWLAVERLVLNRDEEDHATSGNAS